jgi:hypothetical protein
MLNRRALPILPFLAGPALAQPAAPLGNWSWKVMRQGTQIGTHVVRITARGAERVAQSDVSVTPRVLGVVVYRFEHRYAEVTQEGRFRSVSSHLNRNGTVVDIEARAEGDAVMLRGPEGVVRLPANAAPLSWWEPRRLGGAVPIFGTTTGRLMELRWQRIARAGGGFAWRTTGEVEAECSFGPEGVWDGFSTKGDDGSLVSYERT